MKTSKANSNPYMHRPIHEAMYYRENSYWWDIGRREIVKSFFNKYDSLKANAKILDAGCGEGAMLAYLGKRFTKSFGVDVSPYALEFCRKRGAQNIKLADLEKRLPYKSGFFDAAICLEVLEHTNDDQKVVSELHRVLAPRARLFITVPAYQFLWSKHDEAIAHKRRYNRGQLTLLLARNGFKVVESSYFYSFLFPPAILLRLLNFWKKNQTTETVGSTKIVSLPILIFSQLERMLLKSISLPFGTSLAVVAQKL